MLAEREMDYALGANAAPVIVSDENRVLQVITRTSCRTPSAGLRTADK